MEETPEQVLARLARWRDSLERDVRPVSRVPGSSLPGRAETARSEARASIDAVRTTMGDVRRALARARRAGPTPPSAATRLPGVSTTSGPQIVVWGAPPAGGEDFLPEVAEPPGHVRRTLFGQIFGLLGCVLVVVAFLALDPSVALVIVTAATVLGLVAAARGVPNALWWTLGMVLGAALVRVS